MAIEKYIRFIIFFGCFAVPSLTSGQSSVSNLEFELSVQQKFDRLQKCRKDELRIAINDSIYLETKNWLKEPNSFDHKFDSLKSIGCLKSDDGLLKIITWNLPLMEGYNQFYGFLQYMSNDEPQTVELKYNEDAQSNIKNTPTFFSNNWYGALYYQVLTTKYKGQVNYTLLGFIPNDIFTSKKIIDILNISDDGLVSFGNTIFQTNEGIKSRLVFEYSARAVMKLSYNPVMDMIVYDHLSPSSPNYAGRFQFYGPDFSYDGLKFEKGTWIESQDIEIAY